MDPSASQIRLGDEEPIECWDDDDDLQFNEGVQFRAASSTGSVTNSSFRPSGHRDSISSRRSARSDLDSNAGDEDWQVLLHENDDFAKQEALTSAKNAGIPIPSNIPSSALTGGAIKRLSARKPKRTFVDDWSDDVELPGPDTVLQLKTPRETSFPEAIRQVSSAITSPVKSTASPSWSDDIPSRLQPTLVTLDQFQDENESHVDSKVPTVKVPTGRSPPKSNRDMNSKIPAGVEEADDFHQDLELPPDHKPLQLSRRQDTGGTSSPVLEDFDLEWTEGSIGVRVGGTARDGRSIPSSSISIASPSVSSCITGGSEDDGLDGIVFPEGPLDFTTPLKKQQETRAVHESAPTGDSHQKSVSADADDFFSGLEVDNGRAFASGKLSLNPNVKCKTEWPASPTRRSATTLTFTNATESPRTRIPRLSGHDRTLSTQLETVSESGAPLSKFKRSQSRLGHSSQSSVSSLPQTGPISSSPTPNISARRLLGPRFPRDPAPPSELSASSRQLRTKRSLPGLRGSASATSAHASQPAPSHPDGLTRSSFNRPKTPVERTIAESRPPNRRAPVPFFPASNSERQSHHSGVNTYRPSRRTNSDSSGDLLSPQGTFSRLSRSNRPESFRRSLGDANPGSSGSSTKRTLTRPTKRRNFGDGSELESFDDLPTSAFTESQYVKNPAGRGAPRSARTRLSESRTTPPVESPRQFPTPSSVPKPINSTPRFARDTNASRNAREQRIASMNSKLREANPLVPFTSNANWKPPVSRISPGAAPARSRKPRPGRQSTSKPHLIKPMGSGVQEAKCESSLIELPVVSLRCQAPLPVFRVTDCLTVPSRERYAVQPGYFPVGRERKPRAGFRHSDDSPVTEACTSSHRQCRQHAQCSDRGWHGFRSPAYVLAEGVRGSAGRQFARRRGGRVCRLG